MRGRSKALQREHNSRAWAAWHIAALMRVPAKKRLPDLQKMQIGVKARTQTIDQQKAMARMLTAAFGGKIVKRSDAQH